jgi:hypothetical protein
MQGLLRPVAGTGKLVYVRENTLFRICTLKYSPVFSSHDHCTLAISQSANSKRPNLKPNYEAGSTIELKRLRHIELYKGLAQGTIKVEECSSSTQ